MIKCKTDGNGEEKNTIVARNWERFKPWKQRFLTALAEKPIISLACEAANCSRAAAYSHKREDADFSQAWEEAWEQGWERLESKGYDMGMDGDPRLIEFLLKGNKPQQYKDRQEVDVNMKASVVTVDASLASLVEKCKSPVFLEAMFGAMSLAAANAGLSPEDAHKLLDKAMPKNLPG